MFSYNGIAVSKNLVIFAKINLSMNKIFQAIAVVAVITLSSCGGGATMTEAQLNTMADSMAGPKIEEINAKATADCEARMATEVKTTVDSLLKTSK
jgi:hypothetical protein